MPLTSKTRSRINNICNMSYIVVDVESDGPIPHKYSMVSFGTVSFLSLPIHIKTLSMEEIIEKFSAFFPLSEALINYLLSVVEAFDLRKNDYLLKYGQTCNYMYYLQQGLLRGYHLDEEWKETSSWFMREGNFVTAVKSYFTGQPTLEPIHAVEDCQLLGIHRDHLDHAYLNFMEFNLPGRKLTEKYYVLADERASLLRRLSATELYLQRL